MEKEKTELKQDKGKKIQIGSNGGGNVGGLILLGGALAVGSLVAILATRKGKRRKDSDEKRSSCKQKEDQPSQRQQFVLQTSSATFHGSKSCASDGSMEMLSADNLMLEEDSASAVKSGLQNSENNDQEILLDSIEMCDNHCFTEEFRLLELNILPVDELDKDAKNDEATIEVAEEDEMDGVKMSTEEITVVKSAVEEDGDDKEEKKNEKGLLLLEEIIEVAEKEEQITVEICAEKEDDGKNFRKESPLKEMIEVKQGEAIDKVEEQDAIDSAKISMVEIPSEQSIDDNDDNNNSKEENKQAKEKLLLEGKSRVEEEETIGVKPCEEIPALSMIEKEEGDVDFKKGSPLMKDIDFKQEAAENYALEQNLSTEVTECDDEEVEKRHPVDEKDEGNDDKHRLNNSQNNSGGTESSSEGSAADEIQEPPQEQPNTTINAQLSEVKTTEQDENNDSKDIEHFNCSKSDSITRDFTFSKKKENLEYAGWNNRPAIHPRKWRIPLEHMLFKASIVLLFLFAMHCLFYLLRNNVVFR